MNRPCAETPTSLCRAGVARCDVTPPVGIYHRMWGAATHDKATGVHRPLTATALVLQPDDPAVTVEQTQVLIAVDHCLLWGREMSDLLRTLSQQTRLLEEQIAVCFSHTHAAGLMGLERVGLPGGELIPPYLQEFAEKLGTLVQEAMRNVQPVTITCGTGRSTLAAQRDFWDGESRQYVCGYDPNGFADDTVLVARVSARNGKPVATLVNYACHPTTLAWANTLISPDFVGAMREVIEKEIAAPCLFLQGASGDLGPREGFVGDTQVADRNGKELGYAALAALCAMPPPATRFVYTGPVISGATLGAWEHRPLEEAALHEKSAWALNRLLVPLPYRGDLPRRDATEAELRHWRAEEDKAIAAGDALAARDARAMFERMTRRLTRIAYLPEGTSFPLPVTLLRLGDTVWVFVEGEHYQFLQTQLRATLQIPLFVVTLANGSRCSYVCTAESYGKGIYQESIAVVAAGGLEQLAAVLEKEIKKIAPV